MVSRFSSVGTFGSIPCETVAFLPNDTFIISITQPSKMQGEHGITTKNLCYILYFAASLGPEM